MGIKFFQLIVFLFLLHLSGNAFSQMASRNKNIVKLLCILDGEIIYDPDSSMTVTALEKLDANNLGFSRQIKPETAIKLYGPRGKNGVYLVYSKNTPEALASNRQFLQAFVHNYGIDPFTSYKKLYPADSIIDGTHLKKGQYLPQYPGGSEELSKFISEKLRYPTLAKSNYVMGKVTIGFMVSETGIISDMRIVSGKDLGGDLVNEALNICKSLPVFYPGTNNGVAAKTYYSIPFSYSLNTGDDIP